MLTAADAGSAVRPADRAEAAASAAAIPIGGSGGKKLRIQAISPWTRLLMPVWMPALSVGTIRSNSPSTRNAKLYTTDSANGCHPL